MVPAFKMKFFTLSQFLFGLVCPIRAELQIPIAADSPPPYRDSLLSLHRSLVEIESISGNEIEVGNFLVDYLATREYTTVRQHLPTYGNTSDGAHPFNVLARPGSSHHRSPRLLVTSHIDVVPPYLPYRVDTRIDNRTLIHGRGSVDAKASVAAQITALETLRRGGELDDDDVALLFVVGEEVGGDGMRFFSDSQQALKPPPNWEAVVFGEPTENKLACGHKGYFQCRVTARGKAGHSGYPWLGKSANELLLRALLSLLETDLGSTERFGNTTVNIGVLEGGVAGNVIAESAEALLTVRVAAGPQQTGQEMVKREMARVLEKVDPDALAISCGDGYGAVSCDCEVDGECPRKDPARRRLIDVARLGFDRIVVNYGTDVPYLKGNHTRYLYGPGDILVAHSDHEALRVGDLETAVEGYKRLIKHALAGPS